MILSVLCWASLTMAVGALRVQMQQVCRFAGCQLGPPRQQNNVQHGKERCTPICRCAHKLVRSLDRGLLRSQEVRHSEFSQNHKNLPKSWCKGKHPTIRWQLQLLSMLFSYLDSLSTKPHETNKLIDNKQHMFIKQEETKVQREQRDKMYKTNGAKTKCLKNYERKVFMNSGVMRLDIDIDRKRRHSEAICENNNRSVV